MVPHSGLPFDCGYKAQGEIVMYLEGLDANRRRPFLRKACIAP
jgi:hypothetical protein